MPVYRPVGLRPPGDRPALLDGGTGRAPAHAGLAAEIRRCPVGLAARLWCAGARLVVAMGVQVDHARSAESAARSSDGDLLQHELAR